MGFTRLSMCFPGFQLFQSAGTIFPILLSAHCAATCNRYFTAQAKNACGLWDFGIRTRGYEWSLSETRKTIVRNSYRDHTVSGPSTLGPPTIANRYDTGRSESELQMPGGSGL